MLSSIAIPSIVTWIIVLLFVCGIVWLLWKKPDKRQEVVSTTTSRAIWCMQNDPKIARAVLNLAHLEKVGNPDYVRRRRRFIILDMHTRLRYHINDKEEVRQVCRRLIQIALNISKMHGDSA